MYQFLSPLDESEYLALRDDIAQRGVQVPIEYDEQGQVLDGHHRLQVCQELGIRDYPSITRVGLSHEEKIEHAIKLNLARRHLNREQRAELAVKLRDDGWSYRRIAAELHV